MYIPFENLPEESRIWIYPSNRKFSDEEIAEIDKDLEHFINTWSAHGTALEASFTIKYSRFIIIAINQDVHQATGCSIDASVAFIQSLEQKYNVDLLDIKRMYRFLDKNVKKEDDIDEDEMGEVEEDDGGDSDFFEE